MIQQTFNYFHFNLHGLLGLGAAVFTISVGITALLNDSSSKLNKSFFYITVVSAMWVTCYGMESLVVNAQDTYLFQSLGYLFGVPFLSPAVLLFSMLLINRVNRQLVIISHLWAISAALPMALEPKTLTGFNEFPWGRYPFYRAEWYGYGFYVMLPLLFFGFISSYNFFIGWKSAISRREKAQFRNILLAQLIAYTGAVDFLTGFSIPIYPFGYVSLTFFLSIVLYSIIRYQFLGINILLRRFSAVFLIYAALIAASFPLILLVIKNIPAVQGPPLVSVLCIAALIGIILSMGPLTYAYLLGHTFWLKGHISTGLTHELKSPLSAIQGALDIALDQLETPNGGNPEKVKFYLKMIQGNAERLNSYVKNLLEVAKAQEGDLELKKEISDLNISLKTVATSYSQQAGHKGVLISISSTESLELEYDREKIEQTISNLLSNAVKFSQTGTIFVNAVRSRETVTVSIKDQGCGIPKNLTEKIFQRFYQADPKRQGSGIGLTLAKAWVEAHNGRIWAESEGEGKGATVAFTLPV